MSEKKSSVNVENDLVRPPLSNRGALRTNKNALRALIDWFEGTFPSKINFDDVFDILGLPKSYFRRLETGKLGYTQRYVFGHIEVLTGGTEKMGHHFILSGQGCREYEMYKKNTWQDLTALVFDCDGHFTRIDAAIDDFAGYINIPKMDKKIKKGEVKSRFSKSRTVDSRSLVDGTSCGMTIYFGSEKSKIQFITYQKDFERVLKGYQVPDDVEVWNRFEVMMRDERANAFATMMIQDYDELFKYVASVISHYLSFLEPNPNDTNKRRWKVAKWWETFLGDVEKVCLSEVAPDRTIQRSDMWIENQVSTTLAMIYIAFDKDINKVFEYIQKGRLRLTEKEFDIIRNFKTLEMAEHEVNRLLEIEMLDIEIEKLQILKLALKRDRRTEILKIREINEQIEELVKKRTMLEGHGEKGEEG